MNEEVVSLLSEILNELRDVNSKIDDVKGIGVYSSLSNVCDKIDELGNKIDNLETVIDGIKGTGLYDSLSDVCDKIESLETTITLGANY